MQTSVKMRFFSPVTRIHELTSTHGKKNTVYVCLRSIVVTSPKLDSTDDTFSIKELRGQTQRAMRNDKSIFFRCQPVRIRVRSCRMQTTRSFYICFIFLLSRIIL